MRKLKLFLACSSELKADRQQFEIFIARRNKAWIDKGVFIELLIWEDFHDAMSQTRLQDEYNQAIRGCDLFVMLFSTKVGLFTEEEFTTAFGNFKTTNKPLIYTYFKDTAISTGSANQDDLISLWKFQKKLKKLGHFQTVYKNNEDLLLQFGQQLDKLIDSGFLSLDAKHPNKQAPPTLNQSHSGSGDNIIGNQTKIGRQINLGKNSCYHEYNKKNEPDS